MESLGKFMLDTGKRKDIKLEEISMFLMEIKERPLLAFQIILTSKISLQMIC